MEQAQWVDELTSICSKYFQEADKMRLSENNKLQTMRIFRIPAHEKILVALINSSFGSGKDGLVVTCSAVYRKKWWSLTRFSWDKLISSDIAAIDANTVRLKDNIMVKIKRKDSAHLVAEMLREIQEAAGRHFQKPQYGQKESADTLIAMSLEDIDYDHKVDSFYMRDICFRYYWYPHYWTGVDVPDKKMQLLCNHFEIEKKEWVYGIVYPSKSALGKYGMVVHSQGVKWRNSDNAPVCWSWSEVLLNKVEKQGGAIRAGNVRLLEGADSYLAKAWQLVNNIQLYLEGILADGCPIRYDYDTAYSKVRAMPIPSSEEEALWLPVENGMPLPMLRTNELKWAIETGQVDWQQLSVWTRGMPGWLMVERVEQFKEMVGDKV
ncbi:hypothetical protein AV540_14620 [Brevibacillus parabrevis]|uniref:hypothetical protein n=1 Tax=Brevibacillus parabrevis TaxID=54914 RepID=UPI0007ABC926|nr:hypothetical protein [Brevibacillus parabrevis]KZE49357.1 hypothetical protein AV540_14620 [Brevibacillus parabrevis]